MKTGELQDFREARNCTSPPAKNEIDCAQFISGIEHAPGPRGSPQLPQAPPIDGALPLAPFAETANNESCGTSFRLWHFGHSAFSLPYTSASN